MNDIAGEFGGDTPHSLSEYYRNGAYTQLPTIQEYLLPERFRLVSFMIVLVKFITR